jgi:hypothetical protein
MSNDEIIDNAALSPTPIVQIFDDDTNNSSSIIQIPDINNSIQIHDITLVPFISSSSSSSSLPSSSSIVQIPDNSQIIRTASKIDEYFTRNNELQKCRICAATYSGIGKTSTGTLKNHIKTKHPNEYQRYIQTTLNFQRINPYPPKENFMKTKVMINWIIMNMQPFSVVEDNFFIEMIKKFDPRYQMPCRKYIKDQIVKKFTNQRQHVKNHIQNIKNKISLTMDIWTCGNSHTSFLGVTCHYIPMKNKIRN